MRQRGAGMDAFLLHGGALLLVVLMAAGSAVAGPAASPAPRPDSIVTLGENSAEVTLPAPTRYAIIRHMPTQVRTLQTRGAVLVHPQDPTRSVTIERVDPDRIRVRENRGTRLRAVRPGRPIPGFPGLLFNGSVTLEKLQYRPKVVEQIVHAEPVLVTLEGNRAVLEVDVLGRVSIPRPSLSAQATRTKVNSGLFTEVPVKAVDGDTYEVDATAVRPGIENVGRVLADLQPVIAPVLSAQSGLSFNLTSAVVDGTLSRSGFTVTNSKVARRFGIEVGDTITRINGHTVNSPLDAWLAYQEFIIRNPLQSEVRVDLQRQGVPMTKLYRVR